MAEHEDLNTPLIALVGFLGAVIVFAIVLFLAAIYRGYETRFQFEMDISEPYTEVTDLRNRQRGDLASYGWVDEEKGLVSIPIGRAIDLTVREIQTEGRAAVSRPGETPPDEAEPDEDQPDGTQQDGAPPGEVQPDESDGTPRDELEEPQTADAAEEANDAKPE
jgi:hypothetical protein